MEETGLLQGGHSARFSDGDSISCFSFGFLLPEARSIINISGTPSLFNDCCSHTAAVLISQEINMVSFLN